MTNIGTTSSIKPVHKKINSKSSRPLYTYFILGSIFVLILIFIMFFLAKPGMFMPPTTVPQQVDGVEYLVDTNPDNTQGNQSVVLSSWIVVLIAGFVAFQILPVVVAAHNSRKKRLTIQMKKEIAFLCETPMYLGLLGSLIGVCLTQFLTGSLSAPLAYITTITGIVFHLLAKFTIIVPMPGKTVLNAIEEV